MPLPTLRIANREVDRVVRHLGDTAAPWDLEPAVVENPTFCGGSSGREGISTGRRPARSERSAARAARFAERTDANVASASTSVAAAVAIDETRDPVNREHPPATP